MPVKRAVCLRWLVLIILCMGLSAPTSALAKSIRRQSQPPLTNDALLTAVEQRAFQFFWTKTDPTTGLTNDRAHNFGADDTYNVASIASTGYMLAALPVAVEKGWVPRQDAQNRALLTLNFLQNKMPHPHGWFYHFVDNKTGQRVWNSEVSTIDTALLLAGALVCGQYFANTDVQTAANTLYNQVDWQWMLTNGGTQPNKLLLSHGWTPEKGFIPYNWDTYNELMTLVLLGLGANTNPLPANCWTAWTRSTITYGNYKTLSGGPIFIYQMAQGFYNFANQRDVLGWNYREVAVQGVLINRQYCIDKSKQRKTYGLNIWGLNASDGPNGYNAYGAPTGPEDGTVSPTGAIASLPFAPVYAQDAAQAMYTQHGDRIWGRFGFSDAFNVDANWYDPDVIGIDLGMALLSIENYRTGLIWKLLASHPATTRAMKQAGFHSATRGGSINETPPKGEKPRPLLR